MELFSTTEVDVNTHLNYSQVVQANIHNVMTVSLN